MSDLLADPAGPADPVAADVASAAVAAKAEKAAPGARQYLFHSIWLLSEPVVRLGIGFAVGILTARLLGPGGFGHLSYAQSVIALLAPFASLGLDGLLIRRLMQAQAPAGTVLTTAIGLRFGSGLLLNAGLLAVMSLSGWHPEERPLLMVLGLTLLTQTSLTVDQFFQSEVQGRRSATSKISALALGGVLKGTLIVLHAPVLYFALAIVAESAFTALFQMRSYLRYPSAVQLGRFDWAQAKGMLIESSPLIITGVVGTISVTLDQIMLRALLGPVAVGVYAAAARLTEAWYMVLAVLAQSLLPAIMRKSLDANIKAQDRQMSAFYELCALLSLALALPVSIFAVPLVHLLYGAAYAQSAAVLVIHIWAGIFISWRLLSGKWMLARGYLMMGLHRALAGVVLNIVLNLALIPRYGVVGAACASLSAHVVVGFLYDFFNPKTRAQGWLKLRSFAGIELRLLFAARWRRWRGGIAG